MSARTKNLPTVVWVVLTAILCLLLGMYLGRTGTHDTSADTANADTGTNAQATQSVAMTVEAVRPSEQSIENSLSASGVIVGKDLAQVGARVSGVAIEQVLVDVGDTVKAGQVLAILDNKTAMNEVIATQAELKQANVSLAKAQADLARVEPLIAIDAISREQYDSYKTAVLQAQAQVEALQARLNTVKTNKTNTQVIAPVSGVISERMAEVGMLTSGTTLFTIIKNGVLEWQAGVNSIDASKVGIGQTVKINTPAGISLATVTRLSPTANASRELVVHATLQEPMGSSLLKSGMYQSGQIVLDTQLVTVVPLQAIVNNDGFDYVWLLTQTNQADIYQVSRKDVTLGAYAGDQVAVDLPKDSLIVGRSGGFLNDKDLVKVLIQADKPNSTAQSTQDQATQNQAQAQTQTQIQTTATTKE